jgi:hypothetical protein
MSFKDIQANDLAACLKDVGLPVSYNGLNSHGILTYEPTEVLQLNSKSYSVYDTAITLTITTGSLGPLKATKANQIESITVDATAYKIDKFLSISAVETKLWISGVA